MSQDLTKADRFRVPKASEDEFDQIKDMAKSAGVTSGLKRSGLEGHRISPTKKTMQYLMSADRALEQGDPTFEKILGESSS